MKTSPELKKVRLEIIEARRTLQKLEAKEWALSISQTHNQASMLKLAADRRQAAEECGARAESFSANLVGQDKGLVKGAWSHHVQDNLDKAEALEALIEEV